MSQSIHRVKSKTRRFRTVSLRSLPWRARVTLRGDSRTVTMNRLDLSA
jgi:hypothetical protein